MHTDPHPGASRFSTPRSPQIVPHVGYLDARSRRQIALYLTHAIDTAERNRRNLERWNHHLAAQWYERAADQTPAVRFAAGSAPSQGVG